jgi:hypothetical protein
MKVFSIAMILSLASVVSACAVESAEVEPAVDSTEDAYTVQTCNGRPADCDRGDVCMPVSDRVSVCTSGDRCLDARDCRAGYVCRANHCLAIDRSREIDRRTPIRDTAPDRRPHDRRIRDARPDDVRPDAR